MSSFTRTLQRSSNRRFQFMKRGSMLGHSNPKAKDLLARKAREQKENA